MYRKCSSRVSPTHPLCSHAQLFLMPGMGGTCARAVFGPGAGMYQGCLVLLFFFPSSHGSWEFGRVTRWPWMKGTHKYVVKHRVSAETVLEKNISAALFLACVGLLMWASKELWHWELSLTCGPSRMGRIESICSCASGKMGSCKVKAFLPTFMPCFGLSLLFWSCWFLTRSAPLTVRCRCLKNTLSLNKADKGWDTNSARVRAWGTNGFWGNAWRAEWRNGHNVLL